MTPADIQKLARQFMIAAVGVKPGDNVWIEYKGPRNLPLAQACAEQVIQAKGKPFLIDTGSAVMNQLYATSSLKDIANRGKHMLAGMKKMQAYIRTDDDADSLLINATPEQKAANAKALDAMIDYRVKNTRWLVTSAITPEFAKACRMTMPAFEKFYMGACLVDYKRMTLAAQALTDLMRKTDKVHIIGHDTDVTFSIKDIGAESCTGKLNLPDGECFSAPVKKSVNGKIKFGPSVYDGEIFGGISLEIKDGKIVKAQASTPAETKVLNAILDRDKGARYFGEFAIAFNPNVLHPVGDILFDEKIAGSLHFAAGSAYDETNNGNKSSVHWDMVHIQRPEYGGGEIWFDGVLIRKNGIFVLPQLQALNPENLRAQSSAPKP